MELDVILFDWGGTLSQVVRQNEHLRIGAERAARLLCDPWHDDVLEPLITRIMTMEKTAAAHPELREARFEDVFSCWAHEFDGQVRLDRLETAIDAIGHEWVGSLDPFDGSAEALQRLRNVGLRLGLVSNCMIPPKHCLAEAERHGFSGLLDFCVFSSGVGYRKPSRHIYEAALADAFPNGGPPRDLSRVMFVGDSPTFDVAGPAALGMKTTLVACQKGIWTATDYAQAKPDFMVHSVAELPALLAAR